VTVVDVVGIGNALVDVLSHEDYRFIEHHGLRPGVMTLVDAEQAEALYAAMGPATEMSGGSAANTMVGVASFGGSAAFVGRRRDDELGGVFAHDIRAAGVGFTTPAAPDGPPTGRCLVVVTPDAQRTLSTYLGASAELGRDDLDEDLLASARITYLEGYLWDMPAARDAFREAAHVTHDHGGRVAFTLSDPFCVDRHRHEFLDLVRDDVDILLANEVEISCLYQLDQFDDALERVAADCRIAALTRSELGAVIVSPDCVHVIDAFPATVVDTTGAGDLFAAGFLYGLTHGHDLATAGRLGALAAAEVIGHLGARPERPLAELAVPVLGASERR
jgi:sugar/nucleoside kinase (ribokinase family)